MRGRMLVLAIALAGLAGCAPESPVRTGGNVVTYPITIHRWLGIGSCVVNFSRDTIKVRRNWTVRFEMHNNCGSDYSVGITDKDGLFTQSSQPVNVPANGTATLPLTVKSSGINDGQHYKCDVLFKGANHDPDFEVEPGG